MNAPMHVADWVAEKYTRIIDAVWGGEHHLKRMKWRRESLQVWVHEPMSTFDFSGLTRLVVICHDERVRAEIASDRGLSVFLSVRYENPPAPYGETRGHPTLERHVEVLREMIRTGTNKSMQELYRELESKEPTNG